MCDQSIRRLTPDEHADRRYEELYAKLEASMWEEYEREFSPEYRGKYPWRPDSLRVHAATKAQMDRERKAAEEQRY